MIEIVRLDRRFRGYAQGFLWSIRISGGLDEWQRKVNIRRVLTRLHGVPPRDSDSDWPWATHRTGSTRRLVTHILLRREEDLTFLRLKGVLDRESRL